MRGEVSLAGMPESVVDYRAYDFRAVWTRRSAVHRFDQALLEQALRNMDCRRTLEIGTGFGRLSPPLLRASAEYVGVDYDCGMLGEARASSQDRGRDGVRRAWMAANAYHLPFAAESFSSACMIRVHHHLATPQQAIREIARVLAPGATALVSYNPWSRLRALPHDASVLLRFPGRTQDRLLLRGGDGPIQVRASPLPHFVMDPRQFLRDLGRVGLRPIRSFGGVETRAARILPYRLARAGSGHFPSAPVFSTCWVVAQKVGPARALPAWREILACPRCGTSLVPDPATLAPPPACPHCVLEFREVGGLPDARYIEPSRPAPPGRS
jgi:SAM-dependent methyltransferase